MTARSAGIIFVAFSALIVFLALSHLQPPPPLPHNSTDSLFSAHRAMQHVRVLAASPHPVGTESHSKVREYLVEHLESLGFDVNVQTATSTLTFGYIRAATVNNIVAVFPGKANTKAILLAAHYDSAPVSPGASDDGMGIATILESLRALRPSLPLTNDIVVLFSDAEELGLLGAKAFIADSSLRSRIGVAINVEARGIGGPSIMFETSDDNGWIVSHFAAAASGIVASSLTYDVYRRLPNNTDFTLFKRSGMSGFNFANIGGVAYYHSRLDNAEHANPATLQHHGDQVLPLLRSLGKRNLTQTRAPNVVYFSFLFPRFVLYPYALVNLFAVAATILFAVMILIGFFQSQLHAGKTLLGLLIFAARMGLAGAALHFLWMVLGPFHPEFGLLYMDSVYHGEWYLLSFLGLAFSVATMFHRPLALKLGTENLSAGAMVVWLVLVWVAVAEFPGASHLLIWPMIFSQAALVLWWRTGTADKIVKPAYVALLIGAIPGLYLFTQNILLLYEGMTLIQAGVFGALLVLLTGTLMPHFDLLTVRRSWHLPAFGMLVFFGCAGWGLLNRGFNETHPKPNSLFYLYEADPGKASWVSSNMESDDWTSRFLGEDPETATLPGSVIGSSDYLVSQAPIASLEPPSFRVISDVTKDTIRSVTVEIRSRRGAPRVSVIADSSMIVFESWINEQKIAESLAPAFFGAPDKWALLFAGPRGEPFVIRFDVRAGKPVRLSVTDSTPGFPPLPGLPERPSSMMPDAYRMTDVTLVSTRIELK